MTDSKHTPGPWSFQYTDENGECFIIAQNLGGLVGASLPWPTEIDKRDFRRVIANARLIATAPELLQALKELLEMTDDPANDADPEESVFTFARAVIAKAEGRASPLPADNGRAE